ncbi:immunoglobulin-like domain-containing protein [Sphingobacterium mizutaii]|uniref:immunoglobulin-like domain-containing protein n=1 Tax=Sphingobacterium mizutaii TaxID=1010 RepID=UPI00162389C4|nr:immunoglobulin-like domain-containing protein [Sphingobacterium mizutaii]
MIKNIIFFFSIATLCPSCSYEDRAKRESATTVVDKSETEQTIEAEDKIPADEVIMTIVPNKFKDTEDKIVSYTITNNSSEDLNFDSHFHIDRNEKGTWIQVPFIDNLVFNDLLYGVQNGKSTKEPIHISVSIGKEHTKKGTYRLVKDVYPARNRDSTITLIAEFVVE